MKYTEDDILRYIGLRSQICPLCRTVLHLREVRSFLPSINHPHSTQHTSTTGIASGKSTAAKFLSEHGKIPIVDCDKLGHKAYVKGTQCFEDLVRAFQTSYGANIVDSSTGEVCRRTLGGLVFSDPKKMKKLNEISVAGNRSTCQGGDDTIEESRTRCGRDGSCSSFASWLGSHTV